MRQIAELAVSCCRQLVGIFFVLRFWRSALSIAPGEPDRRSRRRHTASCVLESAKETLVWRPFLKWTMAGRGLPAHCGHRLNRGLRQVNPSSWFGADGQNGVAEVLWQDGERVVCRRWRDGANGDRQSVLAVLPSAEHPIPANLTRLAHEYGLRDDLDDAWAARPLELVREHGQTILVLNDPGGEPLDRLIGSPMEVGTFLRLAIALSAAICPVHERGLVSKGIKPTTLLFNSATGQAWLTGFGVGSRLLRERQSPDPAEFIAGTLAYMAPEQTGRMNRSIDSRSDLCSLGVTLYQMLTGSLPFTATDPMEWVHCHV